MKTCFVISSIGNRNSETRIRSDALLNLVIKPVLEKLGYVVVRADEITEPHIIPKDIIKHLEDDTLVIADIHDHNPNVFYELGLRNVVNKPYILIKNPGKHPPFDINQTRAIDHPFPEGTLDKEKLYSEKNHEIENMKSILKKFVVATEKDKKNTSESIASAYMKLPKMNKYFRTSIILSVAIIIIITTILVFSLVQIMDEYKQTILEKQINIIKIMISNNIQSTIDSSNLVTVMTVNEYDVGDDIQEFIQEIKDNKNLKIFAHDFRSSNILAYIYLMEPWPKCEFIQYAYLKHMERIDGSLLESCYQTRDSDLYLTSVYPSTGTTDFVIALARTIDFDPSDDSSFDLIMVSAIDLSKFSESIKNLIDVSDTRFILEDRMGQIIFDCDSNDCFNYKNYALILYHDKKFDKYSNPLIYNSNDYNKYHKYGDFTLSNEGLTNYDPQNSILLEGWILHVFSKS